MSSTFPLPYKEIEVDWLDEFLTLDDYDEQTKFVMDLYNLRTSKSVVGGIGTYLTFLKCSIYAPRWRSEDKSLPPIAAWWLDDRTSPWRKHLLTYLTQQEYLNTFESKLNFIKECSISPYAVRNASTKKMAINGNSGLNTAYPALRARHLEQTIKAWLPEEADTLLHCLSPLWTYTYATDLPNGSHKMSYVYREVFDYFKDDVVAQRMLVFLGHKPPEENFELDTLFTKLQFQETRPMPWSMYLDLNLSQTQVLQAEYAREKGIQHLNVNNLGLGIEESSP